MQSKPLPARPSLEQFRKQAKELVKLHRDRDAATFALIREWLPALAGKSDEEIVLYPFALHDAQSIIARQYGFTRWNDLRDAVEKLETPKGGITPEPSVQSKFEVICRSYEKDDYDLYCSVMNDQVRNGVSEEYFHQVVKSASPYFHQSYSAHYFGEMSQAEHAVYFWRVSASGTTVDLMVRMAVKDDLVSGILISPPFAGGPKRK